jgi:hypothetical protein
MSRIGSHTHCGHYRAGWARIAPNFIRYSSQPARPKVCGLRKSFPQLGSKFPQQASIIEKPLGFGTQGAVVPRTGKYLWCFALDSTHCTANKMIILQNDWAMWVSLRIWEENRLILWPLRLLCLFSNGFYTCKLPKPSNGSPSPSGFPHQNPVCTSSLPHTCYTPCPSHSSRFDHRATFDEQHRS